MSSGVGQVGRGVRMGFHERLESVYRAERKRLFTYALSILRDEERSEDVVHDVFQKLCQAPPEADDLRAFVFRCVRNRAFDALRKDARTKSPLIPERGGSIYALDSHEPWAYAVSRERAQQVERSLHGLATEQREVVVLHIYGDMTFSSISMTNSLRIDSNSKSIRPRNGFMFPPVTLAL